LVVFICFRLFHVLSVSNLFWCGFFHVFVCLSLFLLSVAGNFVSVGRSACRDGELREISGQIQFGYDNWESNAKEDEPWFDFLCANHVRNLLIDEFNRLFEQYIKTYLGADLEQISRDGNGRTRVEASGLLLLRSMCRLTHKGHQQYAKGDGHRFEDWLQEKYNGEVKNRYSPSL
jgi:hypothetical protein